ncbi:MAG: hypothetical protein R3C16_10690 [Hyphomonadaceae bacterium]
MRYQVEYLRETTEEYSVCHVMQADGDLDGVEAKARIAGQKMALRFGADGFQIRDLSANGRIVVLETFDDPLSRFWPDTGHKVIH